jgi:hypothetical protein
VLEEFVRRVVEVLARTHRLRRRIESVDNQLRVHLLPGEVEADLRRDLRELELLKGLLDELGFDGDPE